MSDPDRGLEYPKLRPVDAFPVELQGQRVFYMRDLTGFSPGLVLSPHVLLIALLFDGSRGLEEILAEFTRRTSQILPRETLERIVRDLDETLYLESPRFRAREEETTRAFREARVRPAAHCGQAYDADPAILVTRLREFFSSAGKPLSRPDGTRPRFVRGLIAPHIDYQRGGVCYAHAYAELVAQQDADLYVILGTSHSPTRNFFSITCKDFETPWGPLETDREFMEHLQRGSSTNLLEDEMVHRTEHSIELNAVFLKFLNPHARIAPILVGSFQPMVEAGVAPSSVDEVASFLHRLQETEQVLGRRVCYVAAADLSHIGTRFGDPEPPDDALMEWVGREDLESLQAAVRGDADGWFHSIAKDMDRRRICGLSPIYCLLSLLDGAAPGQLLKYQQCNEPTGTQNVAIASVVYHA